MMLYGHWIGVEEAKSLMGHFIWWSKIMHVFFNKIERTAPSETLGKRTIGLHGNKLDERIHADKTSKCAIRGKLTMKLEEVQRHFRTNVN